MRRGTALGLFLLNFLLTMPYWSTYFGMDDEAVTVLGASRILQGEWPYYHWDTRHTGGSYLLTALYFAVFGTEQLATRTLMGLLAAASGLLIYAIGRRALPGRLALLPWLLWCCGGLTAFPLLSYHWWGTLFTLSTFYLVTRWREQERFAVPSGIGAALALWTLQSDGLASTLMIVLIWLRYRPRGLVKAVGSAVLASVLLWAPFLPVVSQVWKMNVVDLAFHLPYNRYPYNWTNWLALGRLSISTGLPSLPRAAILSNFWLQTQTYGFYYITVLLSLVVFERSRRPQLAALAWCALAWAAASGNRQTVSYLSFSCPAIFLCEVGLLSLLPRATTIGAIWAGLELLGMGARVGFLQSYWTYPIATRSGVYRTDQEPQARAVAQAHLWCDRYFPPGSKVLSYPYFCSLYTTEKLRNPLRVPVLTPFLYDQHELETARRLLSEQKVQFILYQAISPEVMQASYGIPAEQYRQRSEQELNFLTSDYRLLEGGGPLRLYQRLPDR